AEEKIWRNVEGHGAEIVLGRRIVSLDLDAHTAVDDAGDAYVFERIVLAIGGGFIGSEIAAALSMQGREVTMVFPEAGVGARTLPPALSGFVTDYYRDHGVEIRAESMFESGEGFDAVVAGLGIVPRVDLAEAAGLPVDDGIVVDAHGRVDGRDDVFAAGDVARFPMAALGRSGRVEHEDHANS